MTAFIRIDWENIAGRLLSFRFAGVSGAAAFIGSPEMAYESVTDALRESLGPEFAAAEIWLHFPYWYVPKADRDALADVGAHLDAFDPDEINDGSNNQVADFRIAVLAANNAARSESVTIVSDDRSLVFAARFTHKTWQTRRNFSICSRSLRIDESRSDRVTRHDHRMISVASDFTVPVRVRTDWDRAAQILRWLGDPYGASTLDHQQKPSKGEPPPSAADVADHWSKMLTIDGLVVRLGCAALLDGSRTVDDVRTIAAAATRDLDGERASEIADALLWSGLLRATPESTRSDFRLEVYPAWRDGIVIPLLRVALRMLLFNKDDLPVTAEHVTKWLTAGARSEWTYPKDPPNVPSDAALDDSRRLVWEGLTARQKGDLTQTHRLLRPDRPKEGVRTFLVASHSDANWVRRNLFELVRTASAQIAAECDDRGRTERARLCEALGHNPAISGSRLMYAFRQCRVIEYEGEATVRIRLNRLETLRSELAR